MTVSSLSTADSKQNQAQDYQRWIVSTAHIDTHHRITVGLLSAEPRQRISEVHWIRPRDTAAQQQATGAPPEFFNFCLWNTILSYSEKTYAHDLSQYHECPPFAAHLAGSSPTSSSHQRLNLSTPSVQNPPKFCMTGWRSGFRAGSTVFSLPTD